MASPRICSVAGCGKPHQAHELCATHLWRLKRHGDVHAGGPIAYRHPRGQICAAPGCGASAKSGGYCRLHYERLRRCGSLTTKRAPAGTALAWIDAHVGYDGDACLFWPFHSGAYPTVNIDGRTEKAHRVMCRKARGEPPTPHHEAAHSCGRGDEGCISPRHLRWATSKENHSDKIGHGTMNYGERCGAAKLTKEDIRQIRALEGKMLHREIAELFGVSRPHVSEILARKTWCWLEG